MGVKGTLRLPEVDLSGLRRDGLLGRGHKSGVIHLKGAVHSAISLAPRIPTRVGLLHLFCDCLESSTDFPVQSVELIQLFSYLFLDSSRPDIGALQVFAFEPLLFLL